MTAHTTTPTTPTSHIVSAFAVLYVVWGSTYLGMSIAAESMPPFLMAAARFIFAGLFFYVLLRLAGSPPPTKKQWRSALISGLLLFLGGNGLICWALLEVPSSIAALLVTITPLWMTLIPWIAGRTERPRLAVFMGIALGFGGVALLIGIPTATPQVHTDYIHLSVIVLATILWALGSLAAKAMPLPNSPWMSSAAQMLCGGIGLGLAGFALGERVDFDLVTIRSWTAFIYLTIIGSIAGFGTYVFLLKNTTMARVSTYAFVNPVVAVALGYFLADEPITLHTLLAGGLIIVAVILILRRAPSPTLAATAPVLANTSAQPTEK